MLCDLQAAHVADIDAAKTELGETVSRLQAGQQRLLQLIAEVEVLESSSQGHQETRRRLQDEVSNLEAALEIAQVTSALHSLFMWDQYMPVFMGLSLDGLNIQGHDTHFG